MPKKIIKGERITKREVTQYDLSDKDDSQTFFSDGRAKHEQHGNRFNVMVAPIEAWATWVMDNAEISPELMPKNPPPDFNARHVAWPDDSREDFAKKLLNLIDWARMRIERDDAENEPDPKKRREIRARQREDAARASLEVGYWMALAELKFQTPWEGRALAGRKWLKIQSDAGFRRTEIQQRKSEQEKKNLRAEANRIRKLDPTITSKRWLAKRVRENLKSELSEETIRKVL